MHIALHDIDRGQRDEMLRALTPASRHDNKIAALDKLLDNVTADKTTAADHADTGHATLFLGRGPIAPERGARLFYRRVAGDGRFVAFARATRRDDAKAGFQRFSVAAIDSGVVHRVAHHALHVVAR